MTVYKPRPSAPPKEIEARAGVEPLEALHAERREVIKRLAPLELLFGSGGDRWTAIRRQHRDTIAKLLMTQHAGLSDKKMEALANADERHIAFCEQNEARYASFMELKTKLTEIEERIENRLAEMRYTTAEMRLNG